MECRKVINSNDFAALLVMYQESWGYYFANLSFIESRDDV